MQSLILEIWFCLLAAFILGLLLGWLLRHFAAKREKTDLEDKHKEDVLKAKEDGNANFKSLLDDLGSLKTHYDKKAKASSPVVLAPIEVRASLNQIENAKKSTEIPVLDASEEANIPSVTDVSNDIDVTNTSNDDIPSFLLTEVPAADDIDDLTSISGVGPKLQKMLNKLGIYKFEQIANLTESDVEWVSEHLDAFKDRILEDDWVTQAKKILET